MIKVNLKICRLCVKMMDDEKFEILETLRTDMLNVIMRVDKSSCLDQIICWKCADILQKCFDFKMICLNTEDYIKTFSNVNDPMKISLKDICFKELSKDSKIHENQKICRLCLNWDSSHYVSMEDEFDGRPLLDLLLNCLPELDLDLTNAPLICSSCVDLLNEQITFVLDIMEVEKKIKIYQDLQGNTSPGTVDLYNVIEFSQQMKIKDEFEIGIVKLENTIFSLHEDTNFKVEPKDEINDNCLDVSCNVEMKQENEENYEQEQKMSIPGQDKTEEKNILEQGGCSYTTSSTSDIQERIILYKNTQEFQDSNCSSRTRLNSHQKGYMSDTKNCIQPQMHKCTEYPYEFSQRRNLVPHIRYNHKEYCDLHKRTNYSLETKRKDNIFQHIRCTHTESSQLQLYKCTYCSYKAKRKYTLQRHLIAHTNPSQLQMNKCAYCSYETKHKVWLERHMIVHKEPTELQMYKCTYCSYKAKRKDLLVRHIQNKHEEYCELQLYNCPICSYETKRKDNLIQHIRYQHTKSSELQLYKCANCSYETKYKCHLKEHMLIHNHSSELQMYKCTYCSYETKQKVYLKTHVIMHKDPGELQLHKCAACSYKATSKRYLRHQYDCTQGPQRTIDT